MSNFFDKYTNIRCIDEKCNFKLKRYIYSAADKEKGINVIIKKQMLKSINFGVLSPLNREYLLVKNIPYHYGIQGFLDYYNDTQSEYLVSEENENGDIIDYSYKQEKFILSISDVDRLTKTLVSTVYFLHKHDIYHLDIKPENIFVTKQKTFKLGDFGHSRRIEKQFIENYTFDCTFGSMGYTAPEVYDEYAVDNNVSLFDIWSIGATLYTVLLNYNPILANDSDYMSQTRYDSFDLGLLYGSHEKVKYVNLLEMIFKPQSERIRIDELYRIINCSWKVNIGGFESFIF